VFAQVFLFNPVQHITENRPAPMPLSVFFYPVAVELINRLVAFLQNNPDVEKTSMPDADRGKIYPGKDKLSICSNNKAD